MGGERPALIKLDDGVRFTSPAIPRVQRYGADRRDFKPDLAFLPIGDLFTMSPREAAVRLPG